MLVSDYIAECLADNGIEKVFVFQGGSCARLIDSIACNERLSYFCNLHEQASSMAADAMARITGKISAVIATSGPGATNLLTGCAGAWYDSVPVLFITGQVARGYLKNEMNVRQNGFQETDVLPIFREVTKYAVRVTKPEDILYEIEKAIHIAMSGRKGPVLVDLPEDIQRMEFKEENFRRYHSEKRMITKTPDFRVLKNRLQDAKRPVFVVGQGVHCALAEKQMADCIEKFQIPAVFTYAAIDILPSDHPLNFGNFGINGHPSANAIIQNADLLVFMGTRLDHHLTGKKVDNFAPNAKKILIEIDQGEIDKFNSSSCHMDICIHEDMKNVLDAMLRWEFSNSKAITWSDLCRQKSVEIGWDTQELPRNCFEKIAMLTPEKATVVFDTGSSLLWGMHYFRFKQGQRCISEFNHTAMGYALPAAIGAALAQPDNCIVCIMGDGGAQLNIQELATIKKNNLNVKLIIFDNASYALMHGAQNAYMSGRHAASTDVEGLPLPRLENVIKGYGLPVIMVDVSDITENAEVEHIFTSRQAGAVIIRIDAGHLVENQVPAMQALSDVHF